MKQNPMYDPLVLTGLAMMKGGGFANAMSEAATTNYNLQQAQKIQQEQQQAQFLAQQMPKILQSLQGKSSQEIFAALAPQFGHETAAVFAKNLAPSKSSINEDVVINHKTGETFLKQKKDGKVTGFDVVQPGYGGSPMSNLASQGAQGTWEPQVEQKIAQQGQYTQGFEPPQRNYETPVENKERRKEEGEIIADFRAASIKASQLKPSIDSLRQSLKQFNTGSFADTRKNYAKAEKFLFGTDIFGINPADAENIEATSAELVMPLIERNKGAASDRDMELFLKSVPSIHNSGEGNEMLLDTADALNARSAERFKATKAYQRKFRTLDGFIEKWDQYIEDNRILKKDENGKPRLHKNNIKNWRSSILGEESKVSQSQNAMELSTEELMKIAQGE